MNNRPKVTIATLAYNAQDYIAETIESVLNQTEPDFEYVIRDNGSTDRTYQIIKKYADNDKRIKIIRNRENHKNDDGTPLAFAQYCPEVNGTYICFLDSDDLMEADFVEYMYHTGERAQADIVVSGTTYFDDNNPYRAETAVPPELVWQRGDSLKAEDFILLYKNLRPLWGKLYRTDLYNKYKHSTVSYTGELVAGGDTAIVLYFLSKSDSLAVVSRALIKYRVKTSGHYRVSRPEAERIKDGEYLFYCTLETLEKLEIDINTELVQFLYEVYYSHLYDLIAMCQASAQLSWQDKMAYYEQIFAQPLFNYIKGCSGRNPFTMTADSVVEAAGISQRSYLQNLLNGEIKKEDSIPRGLRNLSLIMGIFAVENTFAYGSEKLAQLQHSTIRWEKAFIQEDPVLQKSLVQLPKQLRRYICKHSESNGSLKSDILEALDSGDLHKALTLDKDLLNQNPVDLEGLYLGIVIAHSIKDKILTCFLASVSDIFWEGNDELAALLQQVRQFYSENNPDFEDAEKER